MVRLAEKDTSTEEHTRRVASLAVELGEELGISRGTPPPLAIGGLLHDVGKLSVPDSILQKPGPLDDDEFAIVKLHPERGHELLTELGGFDESVERLVLDHHERLDGTGYPRGSRPTSSTSRPGSSTSPTSTTRWSRPASTARPGRERALSLIHDESGTAFDPRCVERARARIVERDLGSMRIAS